MSPISKDRMKTAIEELTSGERRGELAAMTDEALAEVAHTFLIGPDLRVFRAVEALREAGLMEVLTLTAAGVQAVRNALAA